METMVMTNARRKLRHLLALTVPLVLVAAVAPVGAEDLRGRWYFGGNLSYLSTIDDIRNNSAIIFTTQYGDDGIPFTGDLNEVQGCGEFGSENFSDPFCDPRPDDLLGRDIQVEEDFYAILTGGYGMNSWLSLQVDIGYYKGDLGPLDVFLRDAVPSENIFGQVTALRDRQISTPIDAGELTQIPLTLAGIVRFRKDSPLNPYLGVGAGVVFTEFAPTQDLHALSARLDNLRIRAVGNSFGREITPPEFSAEKSSGQVPFVYPIVVEIDDAFQWHLNGGVEYFVNDRFSMIFDARYAFVDRDISIRFGGQDQIDLIIFPETLFRSDGSTQIFNAAGFAPNTSCAQAFANIQAGKNPEYTLDDFEDFGCDPDDLEVERFISPSSAGIGCPIAVGDFDGDGLIDRCYNAAQLTPSPAGVRSPTGVVVVQGGAIDLTAFSVSIGARFHF